jgi:sugar phosphate isomerase/epimerase
MHQFHVNRGLLIAMGISVLATAVSVRAVEPAAAEPPAWAPPLYGFCMETHDAQKRSLPEQAQMLRELGFPGVGYPLWLDENLERNLATLDAAELKLFLLYASVNVNPKDPPYDPRLPDAIRKLKGRPVTVSVLLRGFKPGDPQGQANAVTVLRTLGDVAAEAGLRISIYHHVNDWTESLLHALQVVRKTDHPQVGVNFNLCHWLKIDGDQDYHAVLRENADKIFAVTINGAQVGSSTWTDGLIQPLDRGDFDNRQLLATLQEIGYRGPIGLMCYGIQGDAREHLERSMKVWNSWR